MTNPAKCHCGSISWELRIEENRYICANCKRPLWQPIETAPKNGTRILAYWADTDEHTIIEWWQYSDTDEGTWRQGGSGLGYDSGYADDALSHWMPLPEPPK
jgi:hypothetical protein